MSPLHILHLSPPPSLSPLLFFLSTSLCLFPPSISWMDPLWIISIWSPAYLGFCWWCVPLAPSSEAVHMDLEKKNKGGIWAEWQKYRDRLYLLQQPSLSGLEPVSDISKETASQGGKSRQKRFNKGFPPFYSCYRKTHIDWASMCRVWALFHLFEWETKERPFVVLARVNLHKAITACNL